MLKYFRFSYFIVAVLTREHDGWEQAAEPDHSRRAQSGREPCSGAERRDKVLDEVSTAIHGGKAAVNAKGNLLHHLRLPRSAADFLAVRLTRLLSIFSFYFWLIIHCLGRYP